MEKPMLGEDPWIFLFWEEISMKTIKNTDLEKKIPCVFVVQEGVNSLVRH